MEPAVEADDVGKRSGTRGEEDEVVDVESGGEGDTGAGAGVEGALEGTSSNLGQATSAAYFEPDTMNVLVCKIVKRKERAICARHRLCRERVLPVVERWAIVYRLSIDPAGRDRGSRVSLVYVLTI